MTFTSTGQVVQAIDGSNFTPNLVAYQIVSNLHGSTCLTPNTKDRLIASAAVLFTMIDPLAKYPGQRNRPLHDPVTWNKITHAGTQVARWDFQTKQLVPVHLDLPLFWKSHRATCVSTCVILYHVTGSCKGPISLTRERCWKVLYIIMEWVLDLSTLSIHEFRAVRSKYGKNWTFTFSSVYSLRDWSETAVIFFYTGWWQFLHNIFVRRYGNLYDKYLPPMEYRQYSPATKPFLFSFLCITKSSKGFFLIILEA